MRKRVDIMKNKRGFTLVELLAVFILLALIILLIASSAGKIVNNARNDISDITDKAILRAAEKWTVDNSYIFDDIESSTQVALDVVFILDVSGSMIYTNNNLSNGKSRAEAMIDATNSAFKVLIPNNPDNRVSILLYGTDIKPLLLPLDKYYSTNNNYIKWEKSSDNCNGTPCDRGTISFPNLYTKLGNKVTNSYKFSKGDNTNIQAGFYQGSEVLLNATDDGIKRLKVVIMLTDGSPSGYNIDLIRDQSLVETYLKDKRKAFQLQSDGSIKESDVEYLYYKDELAGKDANNDGIDDGLLGHFVCVIFAGYESRNALVAKYGEKNVFFYNIGFGVGDFNNGSITKALKPSESTNLKHFNYVTEAYINENMTHNQLVDIFYGISTEVVNRAAAADACVSVETLYNEGYLSKKDFDKVSSEVKYVTIKAPNEEEINGNKDYTYLIRPGSEFFTFNDAEGNERSLTIEEFCIEFKQSLESR